MEVLATKYSRTLMAQTLMVRLPWLIRTNFHGPKDVQAIEVRLYNSTLDFNITRHEEISSNYFSYS